MSFRAIVSLLVVWLGSGCGPTATPVDGGGDDAAIDAAPECRADADCDDGLFCDGTERCTSGRCAAGAPMRCDDGIACTTDVCSEALRACTFRVPDADGDGVGAATCTNAMGTPLGTDCDDADGNRFPGNPELCDAAMHDEDCDDATHGGTDSDGDGYEDARCCNGTPGSPGARCGDDCDDGHASAHPGATEACNLVDDDCDGTIDDGVATAGFADHDRDGYGDPAVPMTACASAAGFAADGGDCDDTLATRSPGLVEFCDGVDNDCDGTVDDSPQAVTWYRDADGDGFGSAAGGTLTQCNPPAGYSVRGGDCNDASAAVSPASPELCNAIDDDCNGAADFVIATGNLEDDDGDGVADAMCGAPLGTDCDDRDASSARGAIETCDGRDNDCDARIDEGAAQTVFYRDADGDTFGSASDLRTGCTQPAGYVRRGGDCDDTRADRFPGQLETCDARDEDCDGATDEAPSASSCPAQAGTIFACTAGTCFTAACQSGYADCSTTAAGCETQTSADPDHCGSCAPCPTPLSSCGAGHCGPTLGSLSVLQASTGDVDVERVLAVPLSTDVIVVGGFSGQLRLGTTTYTSAGGYDGFAARLRRDGSVVWSGQWGGTGNDAMHAAAMLPDGSAFVVGGEMCNASLCGGPITGCMGFWQRFPSVLAGGCDYASGVSGTTASIRALAMERVGTTVYVYAAGTWSGSDTIGGMGTSVGDVDGFVLRARERTGMQPLYEWRRQYTGIYPDVVEDLALDGTSNLATVGWTASSVDFGAGPTAHAGYDDAFLCNLDRTTGALGRCGQFGTSAGYDHAYRVAALPTGDVAVAGFFGPGNIALGNVLRSGTGTHNGFLYSVATATGTTRWANAYDGDVDPGGLHVFGGALAMTGSFASALSLDRGTLTSASGRSAFLVSTAATTGATTFARASGGGPTECSDGAVPGSDGTLAWEIAHSGTLTVGGTSVGGADQDLALVVVTP